VIGAIANVSAGMTFGTLEAGIWGKLGAANAAYISAVFNTVTGAVYAGFNYLKASQLRGEKLKLGLLLLNIGQGALTSLLCGPGATNIPRGFFSAIPSAAIEQFYKGAMKFIRKAPSLTQSLAEEILNKIYMSSKPTPPKY